MGGTSRRQGAQQMMMVEEGKGCLYDKHKTS
jgi:hypothetical protein